MTGSPAGPPSLLDRRTMLMLVVGVCVVNGLFSPYLAIALQIAPVLMPEAFPRTVGWALFFSSIIVSTGTLLVSGVPAALYERLIERDEASPAAMWIWLALAAVMTLPALENIHRAL
jgi:heme/copper-type cytochrome/quinol oxidase subunit 3